MKFWNTLKEVLLSTGYSDKLPSVEDWSLKTARRFGNPSPDDIICAAVTENLIQNSDDWVFFRYERMLQNPKKGITVQFCFSNYQNSQNLYWWKPKKCSVGLHNEFYDISKPAYIRLWKTWCKIYTRREELEKAASVAKETMQKNEFAWDVVEKLLNMKRNEQGALVPVNNGDSNV